MLETCSCSLCLGIDIGTSSIKLALVDPSNPTHCPDSVNLSYSDENALKNGETDAFCILNTLGVAIASLDQNLLKLVSGICIAGQMHGIIFWNEKAIKNCFSIINLSDSDKNNYKEMFSNLIPWTDKRCSKTFLRTLPKCQPMVESGYGCATLFWLLKNDSKFSFSPKDSNQEELEESSHSVDTWSFAGTIVDFVVAILANLDKPVMSPQMAASWGYFDMSRNTWELDTLKSANFPVHLLPDVVPTGTVVGKLRANLFGIGSNKSIYVGLGDLQCTVYCAIDHNKACTLNIGTSSQIACVVPDNFELEQHLKPHQFADGSTLYYESNKNQNDKSSDDGDDSDSYHHHHDHQYNCQIWPYFDPNTNLLVSASLNGGNVLEHFVKLIKSWFSEIFGIHSPPDDKVFDQLIKSAQIDAPFSEETIQITPCVFGERHMPELSASICNIGPNNSDLVSIYKSTCYGLVKHLSTLFPKKVLSDLKIKLIVCSGGALNRHPKLFDAVKSVFSEFVVCRNSTLFDASVGAALYAANLQTNRFSSQ